ncbi:hypothetical protein QBC40DRAFT_320357 [Triangularia verruculosa]|uniref:Glycosyltransferase family 28 N-terminal domain-containing protein n=1 Tax=Triangularia verruculosa TaxID=2587418 RepID=A0AAN6XTL0_9PEZI|nr:hypothetical protein QBC40DRAFT_320357 [Triangularia verruculosa]
MVKPYSTTAHGPQHHDVLDPPPPPYELHSSGAVLATSIVVNVNGTLNIDFSSKSPGELRELLPPFPPASTEPTPRSDALPPSLNIVIQVVGSRGDVQPFVALGDALRGYGHRVRLATHNVFEDFVRTAGLEFYPIGGDPEDLMAYMVKNPGLIPSLESLRSGDVSRKRKMVAEMVRGCWQSCIAPDPVSRQPFVANAIIANPPSFAHVHCAEALRVPVHMMFTMPWSATRSYPHPLANIQCDNVEPTIANYLSYGAVDIMAWQGLGDVINGWRTKDLGLSPVPASLGPELISHLAVPYTYCWSPALVPKPADWGQNIDICGFFMRAEPTYTPPADLAYFINSGSRPIYVGFGSIVLDDPASITHHIIAACKMAGVRVIISRGWSQLGGDSPNTNDVFYLGDCPHEWLFKQVSAVVHHGGAGTTACGLYNAKPTVIVPFFGDQPFWGSVIAARGAGPSPIPHQSLNAQNLAEAILFCLSDSAKASARDIAEKMHREDGVTAAVQSFHRHLGVSDLTCDLLPRQPAAWLYSKGQVRIKMSNAAVKVLISQGQMEISDVKLFHSKEYHLEQVRWDPLTAGASSTLGTIADFTVALGGTFIDPYEKYKLARSERGTGAGRAATTAAGNGVVNMAGTMVKGTLVDFPTALADGLRSVPRLYSGKVQQREKVTDWKSGGTAAAKSLGTGFYKGVAGLVTKPYEGAKADGAKGFLKGIGTGSVELVTKPGSAMFDLVAYPAQGIYKSIKSKGKQSIEHQIEEARRELLAWGGQDLPHAERDEVVRKFFERKRGH